MSEMDRLWPLLDLAIDGFPVPSPFYRSFYRARMAVWRTLLNPSSRLLGENKND